jgi:hypothetical protein
MAWSSNSAADPVRVLQRPASIDILTRAIARQFIFKESGSSGGPIVAGILLLMN